MSTILVPFHDEELSDAALQMAHLLASREVSYIEGLFVMRPPQIFASEGIAIPGGYITELADEERVLAERARDRFEAGCEALGVLMGDGPAPDGGVAGGWREAEGLEPLIVGEHGRLFDIVVIGRSRQHLAADWNATCEAALFDCGRPVIVAPSQAPAEFGKNVVIAWNCSTETARTVSHGARILRAAEEVTVLTVEGGTVPGPSGADLAANLRRTGVSASHKTATLGSRTVGEVILEETGTLGADMLFKGAYTHTRLRQMIFGGATRHILSHAELPVLMSH
ncbi:MAG: universal stress protein [Chromatiales bacterium]|jgi:nucleotide-binding universal stress UspA family protein|nr:universal stress protein [Chromatiales bacterium]